MLIRQPLQPFTVIAVLTVSKVFDPNSCRASLMLYVTLHFEMLITHPLIIMLNP